MPGPDLPAPDTAPIDVGSCAICAQPGPYVLDPAAAGLATVAVREHYRCQGCRAQLRYHGQARSILTRYAPEGVTSLAVLRNEATFAALDIYEPGTRGPFRRHLRGLANYVASEYDGDVAPGTSVDGLRSEDLMALTFDDNTFDLVITSDVFEHVRHPERGFAEIHRVLRPGASHVFTIPLNHPMRPTTRARVDTSGPDDIHLLEPHHHAGHLVYTDFGADLVDQLGCLGATVSVDGLDLDDARASTLLTFVATKPAT